MEKGNVLSFPYRFLSGDPLYVILERCSMGTEIGGRIYHAHLLSSFHVKFRTILVQNFPHRSFTQLSFLVRSYLGKTSTHRLIQHTYAKIYRFWSLESSWSIIDIRHIKVIAGTALLFCNIYKLIGARHTRMISKKILLFANLIIALKEARGQG